MPALHRVAVADVAVAGAVVVVAAKVAPQRRGAAAGKKMPRQPGRPAMHNRPRAKKAKDVEVNVAKGGAAKAAAAEGEGRRQHPRKSPPVGPLAKKFANGACRSQ